MKLKDALEMLQIFGELAGPKYKSLCGHNDHLRTISISQPNQLTKVYNENKMKRGRGMYSRLKMV